MEVYGDGMKLAKQMDEFAMGNGYSYTGHSALKHFMLIEEMLFQNEVVLLALCPAEIYSHTVLDMNGVMALVFTNQRLIYAQKGIFGSGHIETLNYEDITDTQLTNNFGKGWIFLRSKTLPMNFKFSKDTANILYPKILQIIESFKKAVRNQGGSSSSSIDEIKKLKELLDIEAITQEEFDAKKKQLLGM